MLYPTRGRLCGKIRYRSRVHILNDTLLCCILMPCLGVKIQPQLSEYPYILRKWYIVMFIFLMVIIFHTLQMLLFLTTASTILLFLCYYVLHYILNCVTSCSHVIFIFISFPLKISNFKLFF